MIPLASNSTRSFWTNMFALLVLAAACLTLFASTGCSKGGGGNVCIAIAQSPFGADSQTMPARVALVAPTGEKTEDGAPIWGEIASFEDDKSKVFHKAMPFEGINGDKGILTIGGTEARLVLWTPGADGWKSKELWAGDFGGSERSQRLRDVEIGDVDGDGQDEIVVVTHDRGVVMVFEQKDGAYTPTEIDRSTEPTWIHEVELGDVNNDGVVEIVCTPSDPNNFGVAHQGGDILMYRHSGDGNYERSVVDSLETRHAKEILLYDLEGAGHPQLFAALEGEGVGAVGGASSAVQMYRFEDGKAVGEKIYDLPGKLCRFLNGGDTDGDGTNEIIASTAKDGIYTIWKKADGTWSRKRIARGSQTAGFEHATIVHDLDGNGTDDIIASADKQKKLQLFAWDGKSKYTRTELMDIGIDGFYWNLVVIPEGFY